MTRFRIAPNAYHTGLAIWMLALFAMSGVARVLNGPAEWLMLLLWIATPPVLMAGRLADAGRPRWLGLLPLPAALIPAIGGGLIFVEEMRFDSGANAPNWMGPVSLSLMILAAVVAIGSALLIGRLASAPRSETVSSEP